MGENPCPNGYYYYPPVNGCVRSDQLPHGFIPWTFLPGTFDSQPPIVNIPIKRQPMTPNPYPFNPRPVQKKRRALGRVRDGLRRLFSTRGA